MCCIRCSTTSCFQELHTRPQWLKPASEASHGETVPRELQSVRTPWTIHSSNLQVWKHWNMLTKHMESVGFGEEFLPAKPLLHRLPNHLRLVASADHLWKNILYFNKRSTSALFQSAAHRIRNIAAWTWTAGTHHSSNVTHGAVVDFVGSAAQSCSP